MTVLFLLALQILSPAPSAIPETLQINGIVREPADAWSDDPSSSLGPVLARLDLGRAEKRPVPDRDAYQPLTILGTAGATGGFAYSPRRICEFLCGEEPGECHYEITAGAEGTKMMGVGTPVLAIFGSHAVTDYRPIAGDPLELPGDLLETEFASPIWPGPSAEGVETSYRLRPPQAAERQVRFEYRWTSGGEIYGMDDSSCHTQSIAGLTRVACSNFVLLAEGPKLLLVSMADYGAPAADPIAELRIDGARALLVRLGLKAQTVYGLLVETADGWKARFDPRDYALLC